jgi:broad specificity phosphatase PhoE
MRKLILIKHSKPEIDEHVPSHEWKLSDEGRARCDALVQKVRPYEPTIIIASEEPKAAETGQILATALAKPFETAMGIHEHDRSNVPHMLPREFISWVALFFKKPTELVLGRETAAGALARFQSAVDSVLAAHPDGNLAIVTHGTVMALFAQQHAGLDPFTNWRAMGLPALMVFELPELKLRETVERM